MRRVTQMSLRVSLFFQQSQMNWRDAMRNLDAGRAVNMTVMRKGHNCSQHRSVHYLPIASADS
jgi:hypothetical protein